MLSEFFFFFFKPLNIISDLAGTSVVTGSKRDCGERRGCNGWMDMSLSKFWEIIKDREAWHAAVNRLTELDSTEGLKRLLWF